jgi:hypothetical protein
MVVVPGGPEMPGYDRSWSAEVVTAALQMPGGADLVTGSLRVVPGATVSQPRSGIFGPKAASVQLGDWRLMVSHVVGGIVLAERELPPAEAGAHVAMALSLQLGEYGARILPDVLAVLEGLSIACA